jgi:hypothetical protein
VPHTAYLKTRLPGLDAATRAGEQHHDHAAPCAYVKRSQPPVLADLMVLCMNVSAGIRCDRYCVPMLQEVFGGSLIM